MSKQFINLPSQAPKDGLGRNVTIETKIDAAKSRLVYLKLKPAQGNRRASTLAGIDRAGVGAVGATQLPTMTGPDGSIKVDLVMSVNGGDGFSVEVSKDRAGKKKLEHTATYVVWRRLFYQVSKMKPGFTIARAMLAAEYKKHFIELKGSGTVAVPHQENLLTNDLQNYHRHFKRTNSPFEAHVVLIDRQCDEIIHVVPTQMLVRRKRVIFLPQGTVHWPFSNWQVSATWNLPGGQPSGGVGIVRHTTGGRASIVIDLTGIAEDPTKTPVEVNVTLRVLENEYTGDASDKPHFFIAVGNPRSARSKVKTVVHEVGHGIGMVPAAGNAKHYDNRNCDKGNHCRTGATPDAPSVAQGAAVAHWYDDGTCVMFGRSSEHPAFCSTCARFVKSARMFDGDMRTRGW